MSITLTDSMAHVISASISDYYDAPEEHKVSYADRMAGAISAVLYIAQAEQETDPEAEQPQGGGVEQEPKRHSTKKVTLDMGKVKALKNAGWSTPKIADEMRVSVSTVARRLNEEKEEETE